ncbi:MAG TPA: HAD family phosphatase [Parafilimonas sp.]|nr:HAD family phosphatase [Parafilimonas sp.]
MSTTIEAIVFDLGGVLIDWNPRYVYRTIFDSEEKIDWFFDNICTHDWNEKQDAGYSLSTATEELVAQHPEWEPEIRAYYDRWIEMLGGPMHETVNILRDLRQQEHLSLYALTNWSHETFPVALERFDFLQWFDGILVSGEEKTRKPFPEFYQKLLDRYNIDPARAIFIDDNLRNVRAAEDAGINGIHFLNAKQLREELRKFHVEVK